MRYHRRRDTRDSSWRGDSCCSNVTIQHRNTLLALAVHRKAPNAAKECWRAVTAARQQTLQHACVASTCGLANSGEDLVRMRQVAERL
jgi:hypothetical protein